MRRGNIILALSGVALSSSATAQAPDPAFGIWRNHSNSVHLESYRCGNAVCGKVIWASDKAKADARRGGTQDLIGLDLFRDFRKDAKGRWRGKVFVPDLNKTFSGTVVPVDDNTLKGTGCALGGVICKTQYLYRLRQ